METHFEEERYVESYPLSTAITCRARIAGPNDLHQKEETVASFVICF